MLELHLEKLLYFYTAAKSGSLSEASRSLGISQSAVTKSVQLLESVIEAKLLNRHHRGIALTDSGSVLFNYCQKLFTDLPDLEERVREPHSLSGVLRVGSFETLGVSYWPRTIKALKASLPHLKINIITSSPDTMWSSLENGSLHMVVDAEPPIREKYYSKVLYTDQFGVFIKKMKLSANKSLPFAYVRRAYDQDGTSIETNLFNLGVEHQLEYDLDTFVSVKALVQEGLAIGVLPLSFAAPEVRKGEIVPHSSQSKAIRFGKHRICATCLEENRKDKRISTIFDLLKERLAE